MGKVRPSFYRWSFIIAMLVLALRPNAPAWGASYLLYNQWGGSWHDANKTGIDDSQMCWAAAASNILDWGNWDTPVYTNQTTIFQEIKNHWTNGRGYPNWAWQWWLNGTPPPYKAYAYVNVPGSGNFFPDDNFNSYYIAQSGSNLLQTTDQLMHQGYGIDLVILKGFSSHAITCWGFDYNITSGVKVYTSIYATDSDDGVTSLMKYQVIFNNGWYVTGGRYNGWLIYSLFGLENHEVMQTPVTRVSSLSSYDVVPGAPISPTLFLLGTGLLLLYLSQALRRPGGKSCE